MAGLFTNIRNRLGSFSSLSSELCGINTECLVEIILCRTFPSNDGKRIANGRQMNVNGMSKRINHQIFASAILLPSICSPSLLFFGDPILLISRCSALVAQNCVEYIYSHFEYYTQQQLAFSLRNIFFGRGTINRLDIISALFLG